MAQSTRYVAHTDAGHCHLVEARSFEDAALSFAETQAPWTGHDDLKVTVQAAEGGPERCFRVHPHQASAALA